MNKFFNILLLFVLIFAGMFIVSNYASILVDVQEFDTYLLNKKVNYASDAAIEELLLRNPDINADYTSDDVTVIPDIAVDEYSSMLCQNFNMLPTDANKELMQRNYMKVFVVCTNNGYYVYTLQRMKDNSLLGKGEFQLVPSPKLPYYGLFDMVTSGTNISYAGGVTSGTPITQGEYGACVLSRDTVFKCNGGTASTGGADRFEIIDCNPNRDHETTANERVMMSDIINGKVQDSILKAVNTIYENRTNVSIMLPNDVLEISGTQPVQGPTVLSITDFSKSGWTMAGITYGIGGNEIVENDPVVAWVDNSNPATPRKYWAYASHLAKHPSADNYSTYSAYAEVYTTPFLAAKAGYSRSWAALGK